MRICVVIIRKNGHVDWAMMARLVVRNDTAFNFPDYGVMKHARALVRIMGEMY